MRKKQKNKANEMLKMILVFVIVVFIVLQIILVSIEKLSDEEKISETQVEADRQEQELESAREASEKIILEKLSKMKERDRMEYYFSTFLKSIENKNYEKAYDMLYEEFKDNYFPDLDTFETYVKKTFPKMASIEHTNIERSGTTYILFVTINDSLASSKNDAKEMKFIIQENDINDFIMSFSVI